VYGLLRRFLPPGLAGPALVLWYALLVALVWLCWTVPAGEFRYGGL